MHTRILMSASALFMVVLGLAASFFSHEVLRFAGATVEDQTVLGTQILGALYLGFSILNWSARGVLIGGIYSRPVAIGNFFHFTIASITLVKASFGLQSLPLLAITTLYAGFAIWFGFVLFTHPAQRQTN